MTRNVRKICLLLIAVIVSTISGAIPPAEGQLRFWEQQPRADQFPPPPSHPSLGQAIRRQQSRQEHIKLDALLDALNITDGMTILDIGSGPGYVSFLFAEKLHGTGKVFATDIRGDFVDHISDEARKRGLGNLSAVVVREKGLDEFYGKHRYDLVFLSNVYHCIDNRVGYFGELRSLLKPNARLVFVLYNQVPLFAAEDFSKIEDLVKALTSEGGESPFVKCLSDTTKHLLEAKEDRGVLKSALADDFNRMLTDPLFYRYFYSDSYFKKDFFTAPERDFANWLLMTLEESGATERPIEQVDAKTMRSIVKLNRLFFMKRFGDYLANGGRGAYLPEGDANRHTSKYVMFIELGAAGYECEREMELSPYYDAVVMVPKKP